MPNPSHDTSQEDIYLYTTVTVMPNKKPKKEKDTIFCVVFILVLFCILGEQLLRYTYETNPLNMVHSQYLKSLDAKSKKLGNDHKANQKIAYKIKNKVLEVRFFLTLN
jgi:hypothetical protein